MAQCILAFGVCFVMLGQVFLFAAEARSGTDSASLVERPNILWLTCEDMSPNLGCYGDMYAVTPNLDQFAARGLRFSNAISNAPVCAPARTTIITGIYAPSLGAEHMRSFVRIPERIKLFPQLLRSAGYYTTNNVKEDYNVEQHGRTWDESNKQAHWKHRPKGQPFFAVFNFTTTHESQIRNEINEVDRIHDPRGVRVPAYQPDTPEVRRDWAQYYDRITMMDREFAERLDELRAAGLTENTIVFFFSDHGSGMPRSKRTACNSGLNVPMIVYFPPKWRHLAPTGYMEGGTSDRLVNFVDLAPTILSLVGIKPADWMQGAAFCGQFPNAEPEFSFGFRGRMDERYDLVRSVRDKRFMYVRNFMPFRPEGQHTQYMFGTPTTRVWKQLFDDGKLNPAQSRFWQPRAAEELYDLETDKDEVHNLAASSEHIEQLRRMRKALDAWEARIKDVDLLPEAEMRARAKGETPYDVGHDPKQFEFDAVYNAAKLATSAPANELTRVVDLLNSNDSGVRYWGAIGLLGHGRSGMTAAHDQLVIALDDASPSVRVVAAEALGRFGNANDAEKALAVLIQCAGPDHDAYLSAAAWNALDYLDDRATPAIEKLSRISPEPTSPPQRYGGLGRQLKKATLDGLKR